MNTNRKIAVATSAALLFAAASIFAGCAVLRVDVDVYKGPLANNEDVQVEQMAAMAVGAKPILISLRDQLEIEKRGGHPKDLYAQVWYASGFIQIDEKNLASECKTLTDERARRVNAVLWLYEDSDDPKWFPPEWAHLVGRGKDAYREYEAAAADVAGKGIKNRVGAEELHRAVDDMTSVAMEAIRLAVEHPLEGTNNDAIIKVASQFIEQTLRASTLWRFFQSKEQNSSLYEAIKQEFPHYENEPDWDRMTKEEKIAYFISVKHVVGQQLCDQPLHTLSILEKCREFSPTRFVLTQGEWGRQENGPDEDGPLDPKTAARAGQALLRRIGGALGFERGRIAAGLDSIIEKYLYAGEDTIHNKTDDDTDPDRLAQRERLQDALAGFAGKVLVLANNEVLLKRPGEGVLSSNPRIDRYVTVLQAIGNSLTIQVDELTNRAKHKEGLANDLDREKLALGVALDENPLAVYGGIVDELQGSRKREEGLAAELEEECKKRGKNPEAVNAATDAVADVNKAETDLKKVEADFKKAEEAFKKASEAADAVKEPSPLPDNASAEEKAAAKDKADEKKKAEKKKEKAEAEKERAEEEKAVAEKTHQDAEDTLKCIEGYRKHKDYATQLAKAIDGVRSAWKSLCSDVDIASESFSSEAFLWKMQDILSDLEDAGGDDKANYTAALEVLKNMPQPLDSRLARDAQGDTSKKVFDQLINELRDEHVLAVRDFGEDSVVASNFAEAIKTAYTYRADMAYIRPPSAYLRSSYPSTSLQAEAAGARWRNELRRHAVESFPFSESIVNKERERIATMAEIDKQFWQNINSVKVKGGGNTNYVLTKDDIGNWYVKGYSANPDRIIKSAQSLALFALGGQMKTNMLDELRRRDKEPGAGKYYKMDIQRGPMERSLDRRVQVYLSATQSDKEQVLAALDDKSGLSSAIVTRWKTVADAKEPKGYFKSLQRELDGAVETVLKPAAERLDKVDAGTQAKDAITEAISKRLNPVAQMALRTAYQAVQKEGADPELGMRIADALGAMLRFYDDLSGRIARLEPAAGAQEELDGEQQKKKEKDDVFAKAKADFDEKKAALEKINATEEADAAKKKAAQDAMKLAEDAMKGAQAAVDEAVKAVEAAQAKVDAIAKVEEAVKAELKSVLEGDIGTLIDHRKSVVDSFISGLEEFNKDVAASS